MDLSEAVARRRMVRSFADRALDPAVVDRLLALALRAPTAGNTRGTDWVVLAGAETGTYWDHATTAAWRERSRRWAGLRRAPVVALALASPDAYVARYGEPDKAGAGPCDGGGDADASGRLDGGDRGPALGAAPGAWPVPYWFGDAAFGTMTLLLGATAEGLAACFLGNFRGEGSLLAALGVPDGWRLFGTVLLGHPGGDDHRSASLSRRGPSDAERVHRGRW